MGSRVRRLLPASGEDERDGHFAVDNSSTCFIGKISHPSTPCPQAVNRRPSKNSHGSNWERLLHTRPERTVKPSRGNAARARRETGRPSERDAPGPQDRRETFEDRAGSGSVKTGAQASDPRRSTTSRPQVSQEAWVKGRCSRATGRTVPLLYGETLSSHPPHFRSLHRHRRTCSDDPCLMTNQNCAAPMPGACKSAFDVHGSSEHVRR